MPKLTIDEASKSFLVQLEKVVSNHLNQFDLDLDDARLWWPVETTKARA